MFVLVNYEWAWAYPSEEKDFQPIKLARFRAVVKNIPKWRHDSLPIDTQCNDILHDDTQHNDILNVFTQYNKSENNGSKHNDSQHNGSQHNDSQHKDNKHHNTTKRKDT
jgi:hypothetical protein